MLDLNSVIKASHAISGEIHLGPLLDQVLKTVLENAHAEKGLFILKENDKWIIQAEGNSDNINVLQSKSLDSFSEDYIFSDLLNYSPAIINFVIQTRDIVLLNEPVNEGIFINDSYIKITKPKSILCYPVINQENIIGIIYLENNIAKNPFTKEHFDILTLLSTQISVSVSNSLIYENMEKIVHDRNQKLEQKNNDLQKVILELKQAHTQLVHSEKMASLGTLVAGVAHEINNPTNFVHGIAQNLENDFSQLKNFIFELAGDEADQKFIDMFENHFKKIQTNLNDIGEGSKRIKSIVQDLRTFSRLDEAEQKNIDISEGIVSTLRLVQVKYKKQVEFICDLLIKQDVECWPDQLNQVFMNIMINACQAIQEKQEKNKSTSPGKLYIKTFINNKTLGIEFTDTGMGMSEEVKNRIFEQFFTTKDVGNGTGMGMSISYSIIKKHHGSIEVKSEPGIGTTFTVYLPLSQ